MTTTATATATADTRTENQTAFLLDLLREVFPTQNAEETLALHSRVGTFATREKTSAAISMLVARRTQARAAAAAARKAAPSLPAGMTAVATPAAGYYAVEYTGVLRFYAVREGKGRWAGRVFLNRFSSDEQLRVSLTEQTAVYAAIAADTEGAQMTFAREIGKCYRCARTLTDQVSRDLGIGPHCRSV